MVQTKSYAVKRIALRFCMACVVGAMSAQAQEMPKMPIGMNVDWNSYWARSCAFIDVMKTASNWITYHNGSGWNSGVIDSLEVDANGYPVEIPQTIDGNETRVRFLINNLYSGEYVFLYDGEGTFHWRVDHEFRDGKHYITLDGTGGHKYIQILTSTRGNHVRNIRILPVAMETSYDPAHPFRQEYLDMMRPFQAIRFQNWLSINSGYSVIHWDQRVTSTWYTQGSKVCIEHCIQLCNELDADIWFQIPHPVWDDWIINAARLVRDSLKECLNVYLEYSNELWNWAASYPQSHWVLANGRRGDSSIHAHDSIYEALYAIHPEAQRHPEKDAYMMARTFNIWRPIFEETGERDRLICVAAVQGFYNATTKRVLNYLFDVDGGGCDAVSPASYFGLSREARETFDAMAEGAVTKQMIHDSAVADLERDFHGDRPPGRVLDSIAQAFGVTIVNYEGGSHMYDYNDHHWNDTLAALCEDSLVYDLYRRSIGYWRDSMSSTLNVMYVSSDGSDFLKFGHLTDLSQASLPRDQMMQQAPKYLAVKEASAPKRECQTPVQTPRVARGATASVGQCRLKGSVVSVSVPHDGMLTVSICSAQGRRVKLVRRERVRAGTTSAVRLPVESLAAGVYLVNVVHESVRTTLRMAVTK